MKIERVKLIAAVDDALRQLEERERASVGQGAARSSVSDVTCTWDTGEVIVNSAMHVIDTPNCHVFELDLSTKYAETWFTTSESDSLSIALHAVAETLNVREASRGTPTFVRFTGGGIDPDWTLLASYTMRYTLRVALYRWVPGEPKDVVNSTEEVLDHDVRSA